MSWEEVTAVATLVLAFFTWRLAASTRRLARESNAETRANWMPILIPDVEADPGGLARRGLKIGADALTLTVRNIGRGPALNITILLWEGRDTNYGDLHRGRAPADVLAPGERLTFSWESFKPPLPEATMGISVWSQVDGMITYGDSAYTRYETSMKIGFRSGDVAALLDHQFLGAARDRIGRIAAARHRLLLRAYALDRFVLGCKRRGNRLGVFRPVTVRIIRIVGRQKS